MKKVLVAMVLVAAMATASCAAITLDVIGLAGVGSLDRQTRAAALSFGISKDLTLGVGVATESISKPDTPGSQQSDTALYVNGFYTILRKGDVSQALGAELGYETAGVRDGDNQATYMNLDGIYRVAVKVTPDLTMLFDVEVLKIISDVDSVSSTDITDSSVTLLNGAKIGFSVPVM